MRKKGSVKCILNPEICIFLRVYLLLELRKQCNIVHEILTRGLVPVTDKTSLSKFVRSTNLTFAENS